MIVEIKVMSREKFNLIEVFGDVVLVNNKKKNIDVENFLRKLCCIIAPWEKSMVNLGVLDGESYSIRISDGKNEAEYFGKNKFPPNYDKFLKLISEVL